MDNIEMEVITNNDNIDMNVISDDDNIQQDVTTETGTKNYNKLYNKPQINNVELTGNKSLDDLGIDQDFVKDNNYVHTDNNYTTNEKTKLASLHNYDDTEIRTELNNKVDKVEGKGLSTNDYTDEDKTKLASLENYDDTEVKSDITNLQTNKADKSEIPDVSQFITKTVDDLVNYYKKTQTYTKSEVNDLISAVSTMDIRVVEQLPTEDISTTTIYLVPKQTPATQDVYDEYIYVSNAWEHIGSTDIDLTDYVQFTDIGSSSKTGVFKTGSNFTRYSDGTPYAVTKTYEEYQSDTNGNFIGKGTLENVITGKELVSRTDYGSTSDGGVVKYGNFGFKINATGVGYIQKATNVNIDAKTSDYNCIVPSNLDYAVKTGVTTNTITLSDTEKTNARNWLGAVGFNDYGTTTDAGTVKSGNYGFRISNLGVGYVLRAVESQIDTKTSEYLPIVPAKLDYATKVGITTNTISLTDTEKEKAKSWIGANFNNTVKGKDLDLTDTTASKIQEIKLFGKSSQTVNTGSNLVQYTDNNEDYFFVNNNVIKFGTYTEVRDNGASLYFPEGAKTYGINTRVLVKKLNLEANKFYTITVLGGRDAGYGMNIAQYPVDAEEIYAREAVLGQGRNFTTTFKTEADKWYMLELRTPTAGEGGPRTEAFTMNIMVNEGGPKNWEPYTNGVATPTMTTPSAITNKTSENITITDGVNSQTATLNLELGNIGNTYDTIERYEDGTGKLIKRVYTQNLPNSFTKSNTSGNFLLAVSNLDYAPKLPSGQYAVSYDIMCNQFTTNETWISQNGYVVVDGTKVSFATAQEFNEYFTEHPLIYEYVLDTPIETTLTAEQLEQLDLSMYNVNTQITSDTNLEIEYIANTKQYIDNSLRELTYNRDKYILLADTTITEGIVQPITWVSSGDDDVYDDVVVVAENFLGNGSSAFNIGYKLSNSTDFFTTNQANVLNATTVRNYICETERYLPFKWKCTKRGATNAVADVTHTAIQPMTEWQDKIKEIKVYTSGTGMQFVQGRIRVYGRKRF